MKKLIIVVAVLLGISAPIISLGLWIWLMRNKKYEEFYLDRPTMWGLLAGAATPFALLLVGGIAALVSSLIPSDISSGPSEPWQPSMYSLTNVEFVPSEDCEEGNITSCDDQKTTYVLVSDERAFVEALGSNRVIEIANNTELNISKVLSDVEFFSVPGRLYVSDETDTEADKNASLVISDYNYYSHELALYNIKNLTIKAASGARIVADDPDATVMVFIDCENIRLENLTFGHTTEATCLGQVVGVDKCNGLTIKNCDLFGCGAYGLLAYNSENVLVEKSVIRECTVGLMWLISCKDVTFRDCQFLRTDSFNLIEIEGDSDNIVFENDVFEGNNGRLFAIDVPVLYNPVYMKSCQIYHDVTQLGDFGPDRVLQVDNNTVLHPQIATKRDRNEYRSLRATPINTALSKKLSDPDLIRRLIKTPDMPSFDTEAFEYTDVDGNKVTLIKCKVNGDISEDDWFDVSTMGDDNNFRHYAYGALGVHFKIGWTIASNMEVPAGISEEMYVDLTYPVDGSNEFYVEYHRNNGGRQFSKEYLKNALYNMVGITAPDFEIINYVKDYVVVLQCKDSLSDIVSSIEGTEGWTETVYIDEGDWNYYNKDEDWQVEIHSDINVIKIRLHSWNEDKY